MAEQPIQETSKAVTIPKKIEADIKDILRRLEAVEKALFGATHQP